MTDAEEKMRLAVVADLLAMRTPLDELARKLAAFGWDYDGEGVKLTKQHLANALTRYMAGDVSAEDVETWANHIEGRDDVFLDHEAEQDVEDVLHELANPSITEPLTHSRAAHLLATLNTAV